MTLSSFHHASSISSFTTPPPRPDRQCSQFLWRKEPKSIGEGTAGQLARPTWFRGGQSCAWLQTSDFAIRGFSYTRLHGCFADVQEVHIHAQCPHSCRRAHHGWYFACPGSGRGDRTNKFALRNLEQNLRRAYHRP